jgi:hypothetical protein
MGSGCGSEKNSFGSTTPDNPMRNVTISGMIPTVSEFGGKCMLIARAKTIV